MAVTNCNIRSDKMAKIQRLFHTNKKTILIVFFIIEVVICSNDVVRDEYMSYPNKRLTNNVIKTVMTSSAFQCTTWCSMTDGCLAVNVIGNHDITCELTTGLSNEDEIKDVSSSQLFISNYNKCTEEPGFCLNGATCEPTWTSARCVCPSRFHGDRCDVCSERLQGDGCQECSPRFQGDGCQQCSERFQGDECQQCSTRFQGDECQQCSERFQGEGCQQCTSRFQGDECQQCSELFQGDNCQECANSRFQGDDCQQCSERFQGDNCQECVSPFQGDDCQQCAQGYYGDSCEISFTSISNKRCLGTYHGNIQSTSGNHDNCKQWCVARSDCGGFTVSGSKCDFKVCDSLMNWSGQTTFRKTVN